jgi:hypothetical protein
MGRTYSIMSLSDNDPDRKMLMSLPGGSRPKGRPKLRRKDQVTEDAARAGCRNWKRTVQNREDWRKLLMEAKAHPGLWFHRRRRRNSWLYGPIDLTTKLLIILKRNFKSTCLICCSVDQLIALSPTCANRHCSLPMLYSVYATLSITNPNKFHTVWSEIETRASGRTPATKPLIHSEIRLSSSYFQDLFRL